MLDACVLLPMPLVDTVLRMAESPRLYLPKWSEETLQEVTKNLQKFGYTKEQALRRENVMREHFPEALVTGHQALIPSMTNDEKDRHVLAAAVHSGTKLIVTRNKKDFPDSSLEPYGIALKGPSTFLIDLYDLEPGIFVQKLSEQAQNISIPIETLLRKLSVNVPEFVSYYCEEQDIEI
jgi:hypothetical protein